MHEVPGSQSGICHPEATSKHLFCVLNRSNLRLQSNSVCSILWNHTGKNILLNPFYVATNAGTAMKDKEPSVKEAPG